MNTHKLTTTTVLVLACVALVGGCKRNKEDGNADLLAGYASGNKYEQGPAMPEHYESEGASVSVATMNAIEDTIKEVYVKDFERCAEKEMERYDNRWIAGTFDIEVTIQTTGKVTEVEIRNVDVKERKLAKGQKELRGVVDFEACLKQHAMEWEFDPAPEAVYDHSHKGRVGEAY